MGKQAGYEARRRAGASGGESSRLVMPALHHFLIKISHYQHTMIYIYTYIIFPDTNGGLEAMGATSNMSKSKI